MIFAIDFDGTLTTEIHWPNIGPESIPMVQAVRCLLFYKHEFVLWTCRVDDLLHDAEMWCINRGIRPHHINSPSPTNLALGLGDPRKVYADYYVDDKMIGWPGHEEVAQQIITLAGGDPEEWL